MALKNLGNTLFIIFLSLAFISSNNAQSRYLTQRAQEVVSVAVQNQASVPTDSELQSLLKETLADFANGIEKGDFVELYRKTSTDFQQSVSLLEFNNRFNSFIEQRSTLLPILESTSKASATFSPVPEIRIGEYDDEILVLKGEIKAQNNLANFDNEYEWENNKWKLIKIKVMLSQL